MNEGLLETARYETKFLTPEGSYESVRRWLLGHPHGFRKQHPDRWVNNVYFDTPGLRAYEDNLIGVSRRQKLRLRWYGRQPAVARAALELKVRRADLGWKRVTPVDGADLLTMGWARLRRHVREQLPADLLPAFDANAVAVLANRYRREYFVSVDGRIRVTLDRSQQVFDQRTTRGPRLIHRASFPPASVVEFKFAARDRLEASSVLRTVPLRISRSSKYVSGLKAILGAE